MPSLYFDDQDLQPGDGHGTRSRIKNERSRDGSKKQNFNSDFHLKKSKNERTYSVFSLSDQNEYFAHNLYKLWLEGQICDVEISVGSESIKAHKVILAGFSGYIRGMLSFYGNRYVNKIPLLGVKKQIAWNIVRCLYSGNLTLSADSVDDSLATATFLRIPLVITACCRFLREDLSTENCLRTLQVANMYNLPDLFEDVAKVICSNFQRICKQKSFLKLRYGELLSILPRDDLFVSKEIVVFDATVAWLAAEKPSRLKYTSRLMRNVRFRLISENDLARKVLVNPYVENVAEICEKIHEALRYHRFPLKRLSLPIPRTTSQINCLVACGGLAPKKEGSVTDKVFYCNVKVGEWKHLTDLPEPRHHHAAAVLEGFLFVAGGDSKDGSECPSDKVWRYDIMNDEWLQVASMNIARESFQMTTLDFKLYVVGGRTHDDNAISMVEGYSPVLNKWSCLMPISSCRRHVALASLNGFLYAVGGSNKNMISKKNERYNPLMDRWEHRKPTYRPRFSASLHPIKGSLYLIGGISIQPSQINCKMKGEEEIEIYSPINDQWTVLANPLGPTTAVTRRYTYDEQLRRSLYRKNIRTRLEKRSEPAFRINIPRTEAASCCHGSTVFLIGGYSWNDRERIADSECIDIEGLVESKKEFKEPLIASQWISQYPLRCTGIASVSMTLRKLPKRLMTNFLPKNDTT